MVATETQSVELWDVALKLAKNEDYQEVTTVIKQIVHNTLGKLKIQLAESLPDHPIILGEDEILYMKKLANLIKHCTQEGNKDELIDLMTEYMDRFAHLLGNSEKEVEYLHKIFIKSFLKSILNSKLHPKFYRPVEAMSVPTIYTNIASSTAVPHRENLSLKEDFYSTSEAAEFAGVTDQTIRRWCEENVYPDAFRTPGGRWKIPRKYFKRTAEETINARKFIQNLHNRVSKEVGEEKLDEFDFELTE
ncbi:helix-turn-helix domain-containing protein [Priestia megaterium]